MNEDQYHRLQSLHDRLFEVVMVDADPDNWCGNGKRSLDMTREERGDAQWSRKLAAATLTVYGRVYWALAQNFGAGDGPAAGQESAAEMDAKARDDLDEEIRAAEREAMRALNRAAGKPPSVQRASLREHGRG